jgi:hypothetical protein
MRKKRKRERALPPDVVAHTMGWLEARDVAAAASVCKVFASGCASETLWQEQYARAFGGVRGGGVGGESKGQGSVVPTPLSLLMPPCSQSKAVRGEEGKSTGTGTAPQWRDRFARRFRIERNWLSPETDAGRFSSLTLSSHTDVVICVLVWWERGLVFSGSRDGTIQKCSLETGECLAVLKGHTHAVSCLAGAAQTGTLASGSFDGTVRLWSAAGSGECLQTLRGHTGYVYCVALLPSNVIVSGGEHGEIKVWDGGEGKLVRSMTAGTATVFAVASDGKRIVSCDRIFDMESGVCTEVFQVDAPKFVTGLVLRRDVLLAGCSGTLRSWDLRVGSASMRELHQGDRSIPQDYGIASLCFQEGIGPMRVITRRWDGKVELWDVTSAQRLSVWQCARQHFTGQQLAVDLHRLVYVDGKEVKALDLSA